MKSVLFCAGVLVLVCSTRMFGQLSDRNKAPNNANEGISLPLTSGAYPTQIGNGRWGADLNTSQNVIA